MKNNNEFDYGTPSANESEGLWLPSKNCTAPTGNEFEEVLEWLEERLEVFVKDWNLRTDDLYFRGDFFGDRTQYLEVDKTCLKPELFAACKAWLNLLNDDWRIVVPIQGFEGNAVIVYRATIRFSGQDETGTLKSLAVSISNFSKNT